MRSRRIGASRALLAAVIAMVVGVTACGTEISGDAVRMPPDISRLDVGNYPAKPRVIGNAKNDRQARAREAQRLADVVALPFEADPSYVVDTWFLRSHIVLNRKTLGNLVINDTFDDVAKDLVAGWVNAGATDGEPQAPRRTMSVAVLMFPDAATAQAVGPTLEHDDFTYNRDNQPVTIAERADTRAHWRPDVSSVGSWTVHDRFVVFVKVVDDTSAPDLAALTTQVRRMLDVQIPLLAGFEPTPVGELAHIPLDPPRLLGSTLPSNPESPFRPEPDGLYTGRGALSLFLDGGPGTLAAFEKYGIDLVSFGDAVVFRSRTAKGAEGLWREWLASKNAAPDQKLVDVPAGLSAAGSSDTAGSSNNVECFAEYTGKGDARSVVGNLCFLRVDRYVVQSRGKQLPDLHQKISAQYAMLTSG